jgi:hypothetical protein
MIHIPIAELQYTSVASKASIAQAAIDELTAAHRELLRQPAQ